MSTLATEPDRLRGCRGAPGWRLPIASACAVGCGDDASRGGAGAAGASGTGDSASVSGGGGEGTTGTTVAGTTSSSASTASNSAGQGGGVGSTGSGAAGVGGQQASGGGGTGGTASDAWVHVLTSPDLFVPAIAEHPGGGVVLCGSFAGTLDVAGTILESAGTDSFVARLTSDGELLWATPLGATESGLPADVAVAPDGSIYMIGSFEGGFELPGGEVVSSAGVQADILVVKLSAEGIVLWAKPLGGDTAVFPFAVTVASDGSVIVLGGLNDVADIAGFNLDARSLFGTFVAQLEAADGSSASARPSAAAAWTAAALPFAVVK